MIVLLPYHSDVFPDAQGECHVYPQPGSALGEILQGVYQCKNGQPLERFLGHVTPKESELLPSSNLSDWVIVPLLKLLKCDMGKSFALVGDVHTS